MTRARKVSTRKSPKQAHNLKSGPWEGETLYLAGDGDSCTGWLQIREVAGRYRGGKWEAMQG